MFSLPWLELSRFKRHTITRLAMIVIAIIPAIYGGARNQGPRADLYGLGPRRRHRGRCGHR